MKQTEQETVEDFKEAVNMTRTELESWLKTEQSRQVGQRATEDSESTGHESGRRIVEILGKKQGQYTEDDFSHMKKVVGYVRRHSAQRPEGDVESTPWRYSLMNWGHDPQKKGA